MIRFKSATVPIVIFSNERRTSFRSVFLSAAPLCWHWRIDILCNNQVFRYLCCRCWCRHIMLLCRCWWLEDHPRAATNCSPPSHCIIINIQHVPTHFPRCGCSLCGKPSRDTSDCVNPGKLEKLYDTLVWHSIWRIKLSYALWVVGGLCIFLLLLNSKIWLT